MGYSRDFEKSAANLILPKFGVVVDDGFTEGFRRLPAPRQRSAPSPFEPASAGHSGEGPFGSPKVRQSLSNFGILGRD
jgi:hypothetical protein